MKNSLLILGITLVSLTNVCNATNTVDRPVNSFKEDVLAKENEGIVSTERVKITKPSLSGDAEVFNPETVIAFNRKTVKEAIAEGDNIIENTNSDDLAFIAYEESMKEIIAQSDLIIENTVSNETCPLYGERTLEDEITELEMIIESTESNEARPLNFKEINNNSLLINTFNSKKIIGMN
ncbi:hypothetical protein [Flavobacterium sp. M31R6]|uniref:hypothetical protein n=1 Tax=Flavobacterium sp. M31R6 TaxID=2739062 RepID=UPI00156A6951|nr:hypothetical protein [Flavobacterium sp. M31R6]QKJ63862.1 hypothetical protein HQN62_12250 [Flavobacterium sp. M31R6]